MKMAFRYRFEAAHRLSLSTESMCATPHGHTWYVTLNIKAEQPQLDKKTMLIEFAEVKKLWKTFVTQTLDHSFMCHSKDPLIDSLLKIHPESRLLLFPGDPTTELISILLFSKAMSCVPLKKGFYIISILVEETPTNSIECDLNTYKQLIPNYSSKHSPNEHTPWWLQKDPLSRCF